jgi:rhamnosyl/mannosyltransferase
MRKRKAFVVVTFHAEVVSAKRFSKLYNALVTTPLLQVADRIIATSPQMAETAPVLRGVAEKITVIPFGVEAPGEPGPKPNSPDPATGLRLLFVGRLARYKGLEVLLHALGRTRSALRIVGEGALRSEIDQLVTRLGLHDRVTLLGRVPDRVLDEMYQWADVLVLPSTDRGEAFGYVLIEAMARGVALITTELGTGTSWVNLTEETGLVVRPGDPSALAAAIKRLESDRPLLKRCQMNALRRFQANFVLKRMVRDTYDLYERELLERSKCPVKPCRRETNDDHSPGLPSLH